MSEAEKKLFATAAFFWVEHRQGADFDEGDFSDCINAISARCGVIPSPSEITEIRRLLGKMIAS